MADIPTSDDLLQAIRSIPFSVNCRGEAELNNLYELFRQLVETKRYEYERYVSNVNAGKPAVRPRGVTGEYSGDAELVALRGLTADVTNALYEAADKIERIIHMRLAQVFGGPGPYKSRDDDRDDRDDRRNGRGRGR